MPRDNKEPEFAVYCKQSEVQLFGVPWACGVASLTTCMRLLGDRRLRCWDLVNCLKKMKINPYSGLTTDEACTLANAMKYRAIPNPQTARYDSDKAHAWLAAQFRARRPVMVTVDSGAGMDPDHWWVAYSDLDTFPDQIWIMDPKDDDNVFELISWVDFLRFATVSDESKDGEYGDGYQSYDMLAIAPRKPVALPVPPSNALLEFISGNAYDDTESVAACFVDNYLLILRECRARRRAAGCVAVANLLEPNGAVMHKLDPWAGFLNTVEVEALRVILYDMEAHDDHRVTARNADALISDLALLLVLTSQALIN